MKIYRIKGKFDMGWNRGQAFTVEMASASPEKATEQVRSELGSKHKVKRRQIKIESVEEISIDKVEDPIVKKKAGA